MSHYYLLDSLTTISEGLYGLENVQWGRQLWNAPRRIDYARYTNRIETPWGYGYSLFVKVSLSKKYGDWAMREIRLIRRLQPTGNCVGSIKRRRHYAQ